MALVYHNPNRLSLKHDGAVRLSSPAQPCCSAPQRLLGVSLLRLQAACRVDELFIPRWVVLQLDLELEKMCCLSQWGCVFGYFHYFLR